MAVQLLRNVRVVLVHDTLAYPLEAINNVSLNTSLGMATGKRKTLFRNTNQAYSITSKINPTTINMSVVVTKTGTEKILFELLGLVKQAGGRYDFPIAPTNTSPKLFTMNFINKDETLVASPCYIESIDISFTKSTELRLDLSISAANVSPAAQTDPVSDGINYPVEASHVNLVLGAETQNRINSGTVSIQQVCEWMDDKSLFGLGLQDAYQHSKAVVTDMIFSANAFLTYSNILDSYGVATYEDFALSKAGLKAFMGNARIVRNLDMSNIYTARLDVSYTEMSGDTYIKFGD
ncbi:minor tail protein [Vibrio phage VCPH]|nr:minor tail protein [Vibrio phage VCPH]